MTGVRDVTYEVRLRGVEDQDLDVFFDHQVDPKATEMAAFPARDKDQFAAHWAKIRADDTTVVRTIVADGRVAGNIGSWQQNGQRLLGYWVGREHWGRGVATAALTRFVDEVSTRLPARSRAGGEGAGTRRRHRGVHLRARRVGPRNMAPRLDPVVDARAEPSGSSAAERPSPSGCNGELDAPTRR